ncbi:unnamed protein product [Urochloa decumbens]|uniref:Uncharacterized protein n=1 Tax=Urochloa decumbens TaxID=240449 RepID=A0ABC8ZAM5_9POAL
MGQGERAVGGLREEGEKEQGGGDVPLPGGAAGAEGGVAREAASSEQEDRMAGWESDDDDEDIEEALTEEESEGVVAPVGNAGHGDASSGSAQDEDHEAPEENPATAAHFELRGFRPARRAIAHATPPSSFRLPFRGRKPSNPSRLPTDAAADAASGCGNNAHHHGPAASEAASGPAASAASLGSPSATSRLAAGATAMANAGDNNEALSSTAIRSASKSSDPERDVSPIHLTRNRSPEMDVAVGKSPSPGDRKSGAESKHVAAVAAAGSCRPPSRSRKRRRPVHYPDTEETVAADHARARQNNADLDEYRACVACASAPEQQRPGGGPEVTDESVRVLAIAVILGAALALSAASCVLFYIVGQQTGSGGPSDSHKKKVSEASQFSHDSSAGLLPNAGL